MGAKLENSNADLCAVLPFLPQYPVTWKLWLAEEDDEIDGSGRLFLDGSADHYLSIEDAVTVGTIILDRLQRQYEAMFIGWKFCTSFWFLSNSAHIPEKRPGLYPPPGVVVLDNFFIMRASYERMEEPLWK